MSERQKAIAYADREFSLFIRERDGNRCFLCGLVGPTDCAHYVHRSKIGTRWEELNAHAMCRACHQMDHTIGTFAYRDAIRARCGDEVPEYLERLGNRVVKLSAAEIRGIGKKYKALRKS